MKTVYLAGVYDGDINLVIGVFDDKDHAKTLGNAVTTLRPDSCSYVKEVELNKFDVEGSVALLDVLTFDRDLHKNL